MFIKKTKNSRGQTYYHIAESYWKDGKSKHRTLMSLGRAKDARLEDLFKLISRHLDVISRLLTVSSAMRQLSELRAVPVTVNDKTLWLRTDITGNVSEVFKAIGVKIPSKQLQVE